MSDWHVVVVDRANERFGERTPDDEDMFEVYHPDSCGVKIELRGKLGYPWVEHLCVLQSELVDGAGWELMGDVSSGWYRVRGSVVKDRIGFFTEWHFECEVERMLLPGEVDEKLRVQ